MGWRYGCASLVGGDDDDNEDDSREVEGYKYPRLIVDDPHWTQTILFLCGEFSRSRQSLEVRAETLTRDFDSC